MSPEQRHPLDKNVSPNWRPPAGLGDRAPGMPWSDRLWHWLVSLGGICLVAAVAAVLACLPGPARLRNHGLLLVIGGLVVFFLGFPSRAQRNGYRE